MDNLTHSLVGLAAAKAGLERWSPGTTSLCILAANAPDSDIVFLLFGDRWDFLQHLRGITHSIVGTLCLALLIPIIFYVIDLALTRLSGRTRKMRLGGLIVASLIVSATHPILDWTNNYGIRFLLPWNPKWFYGDLVFIVDPFIWLLFGGASFLLTSKTRFQKICWAILASAVTLLVIAAPRVGALGPFLIPAIWIGALCCVLLLFQRNAGERWGSKLALLSFALLVAYWGALAFAHARAMQLATEEATRMIRVNDEKLTRLAAMPTLANPLRWDCVFETGQATYRFNLRLGSGQPVGNVVRYEKPSPELQEALQSVSNDRRIRVFLGFARFPVAILAEPGCTTQTLVELADLRYTEPGRSRGTFSLELPVDCPNR